ncbi:MAG: polysaccharide biosynthesis tyrosine autokinase [Ancrocorticia sp.]|uniref:polysaccharide biosynthesis tyrosine autokinase n=1 Tax=Ancrocorticia sp. TaxID=2593684 RepID=UPI003F93F5F6
MELRAYLNILRKNWVILFLTVALCVGVTAAWSFTRTPEYEAQSRLYVSVRTTDESASELSQGSTYARQAVTSFTDVVTTSIVLDQVISDLDLDMTVDELRENVSAESPEDSVLINISASDTDADRAADIANSTSENFAEVVMNQLEEPDGNSPSRIRIDVVQPAVPNADPVSPQPARNLALSLVVGLLVGIGLAVARDAFDTKIRTREDIDRVTGKPILGSILASADVQKHPLVVLDDSHSVEAERYRALRTNLTYFNVEDSKRSFVVTSAGPAEGKTTASVNLALALASTGARVALLDADLRRPSIAKLLGIEGAVGLSELLAGRVRLEDVLQEWGVYPLFVLPAGRVPPNPSELLGSSRMSRLLDTLSTHFDVVIVDVPPVLAVTDAAVVGRQTGGTIVLASTGHVKKEELSEAIDSLEGAGSRVLGVVATMVPKKGPGSYAYGSYHYA